MRRYRESIEISCANLSNVGGDLREHLRARVCGNCGLGEYQSGTTTPLENGRRIEASNQHSAFTAVFRMNKCSSCHKQETTHVVSCHSQSVSLQWCSPPRPVLSIVQ